jgi:hypothetical protein
MPPVVYPPLDNLERAEVHLAFSHGQWPGRLADADLLALEIEHYDNHADGCDHIHESANGTAPTFPTWPWEASEP